MPHSQQIDFGTCHALSVHESYHFGPPGLVGQTRMFRKLFLEEVHKLLLSRTRKR
jgi:hypothetical protein